MRLTVVGEVGSTSTYARAVPAGPWIPVAPGTPWASSTGVSFRPGFARRPIEPFVPARPRDQAGADAPMMADDDHGVAVTRGGVGDIHRGRRAGRGERRNGNGHRADDGDGAGNEGQSGTAHGIEAFRSGSGANSGRNTLPAPMERWLTRPGSTDPADGPYPLGLSRCVQVCAREARHARHRAPPAGSRSPPAGCAPRGRCTAAGA